MRPQNTSPGDDDSPSRPETDDVALEHAEEAIIGYLHGRDEPVDNLTLVSVAVREVECERGDVSASGLPLPHVHERVTADYLPALDREGIVEYDELDGSVALTASDDRIDRYLGESL